MLLKDVKETTPEKLLGDVAELVNVQKCRFVTMSTVDLGECIDVLYHFANGYDAINLRLKLQKGQDLPSISSVCFPAVIVENEIKDLFGIPVKGMALDFQGHFLLSEGAPEAPLKKDAVIKPKTQS